MAVEIRHACVADIPHIAYVAIQAFGGFAEVMYEGVVPDSTVQQIMEHRFSRTGTTSSVRNSRIAEEDGTVLGGLHAFPMDLMADDPLDPLIPKERFYMFEPLQYLHAKGSYYIQAVAVYPEFQGRGVGRQLITEAEMEARAKGFKEMSLKVFAENVRAVARFESLGYREVCRQPVVHHERLRYGGDTLLMTRKL
jgi:ribosomal protein S18 acetylase RimI-like enzyme